MGTHLTPSSSTSHADLIPNIPQSRSMADQMTALEMALAALVGAFHQCSGGDDSLNKAEFKKLVESQLPHLAGAGGPSVEELIGALDGDSDGSVDFKEYMMMVGGLAYGLNHMLKQMQK